MGVIKILLVVVLILVAAYAGFIYGQLVLQKNSVEVEIPIKQDITLALDQEINFPLKMNLDFLINKTLYIKKSLPINTSVMIDTMVKVPMNISGTIVYLDVPIKKEVLISTILEINEPFIIAENIILPIDQNFSIPVKKDIFIPLDTRIKTKIPLPWSKE